MPLLVISPRAKANSIDHTFTDQSSITRFVEDNWGLGRIGGSFGGVAGSLNGLLDVAHTGGTGVDVLRDSRAVQRRE
jgi:phospholipase C